MAKNYNTTDLISPTKTDNLNSDKWDPQDQSTFDFVAVLLYALNISSKKC